MQIDNYICHDFIEWLRKSSYNVGYVLLSTSAMNRVLPNIHQPLIQISLKCYVTDCNWLRQWLSLLKKPGTTKAMIGDDMFEDGHGLCVYVGCVCVCWKFTVHREGLWCHALSGLGHGNWYLVSSARDLQTKQPTHLSLFSHKQNTYIPMCSRHWYMFIIFSRYSTFPFFPTKKTCLSCPCPWLF